MVKCDLIIILKTFGYLSTIRNLTVIGSMFSGSAELVCRLLMGVGQAPPRK
jgi:hypothetical protein